MAQPPKTQAGQESWHFTDPENNANIHVVQAPPRRGKTFWQENIQAPTRAWTPPISATGTDNDQKSRRNPEDANSLRHNNEDAKEQDRERSPRRKTATVAATQIDPPTQVETEKTKYLPEPSTVTEALAAGWEEHDLKGNGDCGYRAVAGARHFAKNGTHLTATEAKTHAADLWAQAVLHCKKHSARLGANFVPDTEEAKHQRNQRPAAQTFKQWIENQADPRTWACNHSFQAIAEKTGMILVIFKQTSDVTWHRGALVAHTEKSQL